MITFILLLTVSTWPSLEALAQPSRPVFIQPFKSCQWVAQRLICTNNAISGATEDGFSFVNQGQCEVVRTQRPFWSSPSQIEISDPPERYNQEVRWITNQMRASGCACCHNSEFDGAYAKFDLQDPNWLNTLSDRGVSILAGELNSESLGVYPPSENQGFDRSQTGSPTTDPWRMKTFFMAEFRHRGITAEQVGKMPTLGGQFFARLKLPPTPCAQGIGVMGNKDDGIFWGGKRARYVYVLREGSRNPLVPPNLDNPEGVLWRINVPATAVAGLQEGITYANVPQGTKQVIPLPWQQVEKLKPGNVYHLHVLADVGFPLQNCLFTYETSDL